MRKLLSVLFSTLQGRVRGGLLFVALLTTTCLWAYDFQSGDLYYNITSETTVEVTRGDYYSLTTATIPDTVIHDGTIYSVTSIGNNAFSGCSSLTSITIPNSVTTIGVSAFSGCSSLTSITIPNSVTSIDHFAFSGCYSLSKTNYTGDIAGWCKIKFRNSSANPIYNSHNLYINSQEVTELLIPNSVDSIQNYAFYACSSLTSITISNSVTNIGGYSFSSCHSLTSIVVDNDNSTFDSRKRCNAIIETKTNTLLLGCQKTIIPNSVTSIGNNAFYDCEDLLSVTIPNSVTSIGDSAFMYCSYLTSINFGNSLSRIGNRAFYGCISMASITIPNSVREIANTAFNNTYLVSIVVENSNTTYDSRENCNAIVETATNTLILGCKNTIIPNSVTGVGDYAFSDCSSLTSLTIPNSVMSIGDGAFANCSSLTLVTLGNSVTSIGKRAFLFCSSLTSITIPNSVNSIGDNAFRICTSLDTIYVEAITPPILGYAVFNDAPVSVCNVPCSTLEKYESSDWRQYCGVLIEDCQCGDNLYWDYDEITKTIFLTGFGEMFDYIAETQPWALFKEQVLEVTTSNAVTTIGNSAFEGCIRLGKVILGSSIEDIAANAFAGCTRLYDVYCYATYPPFAEQSSFANYNVYLYVPCESQRNYTLDVVWGNFRFIECIESEDVTTEGVVVTPSTNDVTITWPTETGAESYTIVIKKGDTVFCTLTFNADGQLLNIAFAPGRNGNHPAQYAEQAGNGYRFTVTGLEEGTHYAYNIDVRDAANTTIKSHTGEFTTESTTPVENTHTPSPMTNCQKIIRDNQLLILRDGNTYNVMGVIVE